MTRERLLARLRLKPTSEGGRVAGLFRGEPVWDPCLFCLEGVENGQRVYNMGWIELADDEYIWPGEEKNVWLVPLDPSCWRHLKRGSIVELCDGVPVRVVGAAGVLEPLVPYADTGDA